MFWSEKGSQKGGKGSGKGGGGAPTRTPEYDDEGYALCFDMIDRSLWFLKGRFSRLPVFIGL